jgi:tetratricopeptide (TPR) repeat protein
MARKSSEQASGRRQTSGASHAPAPERLFEDALNAHRQGRVDAAYGLYQDVLSAEPQHAGALQHLGILAQQRGDVDESVRLLSQAAAISPSDPLLQNNLGNARRSQGDLAGAVGAYRAAVASDAGYVNALYNLAGLLQEQGEWAESESCYRRVVALEPTDVGAWMGLGMTLLDQGRDDDALACFERAVALRPEDPVCQYNFGNALKSVDRFKDAAAAFRRAVAISPDYAEAHHNLGMVLRSCGDLAAAEAEFREALHYRPDHSPTCASLAGILYDRGDYAGAEQLCRRALAAKADNVGALLLLGRALWAQQRNDEALQVLRRAEELEPENADVRIAISELLLDADRWSEAAEILEQVIAEQPLQVSAHSALSRAYMRLHRTAAAIEVCRKAIGRDADFADGHCNLGLALRQSGDMPGAIEAFQTAVRIDPEFAEAHNNLGIVYMDIGDMVRAADCFREALKFDPQMAASSLNMSRARRFGEADLPEISRIEALLAERNLSDEGRMNLHFALGKMFDDCASFDKAFEHFQQANQYKRKRVRFNGEHYKGWSARFGEVFTRAWFEQHRGLGDPSERPVFIVGMPRSGTTLVEQILASHPGVHGADELTTIFDIICSLESRAADGAAYPDNVSALEPSAFQWAAREYLDKLDAIDSEAARVTDKMPTNFFHLGFIATILPAARIIHCRRDAMDVCLSNFVQMFAEGHYYSYDLADIAIYYRGYEMVMSHWREVLPVQMYEVRYEELVEDQERVSRELVAHLGLPWDDRCLAFHETKRAVRTASNWQVRQPIYKSARKRWKNYERNLAQLKADLGYVEEA